MAKEETGNIDQRQHRRIEKRLTIKYCLLDAASKKWDMSIIENISAGGIRFKAPTDLELMDKTIQLHIKIPELAPRFLELEAIVLETKPRPSAIYSDVRAKFINLSESDKEHLSIIEKIINLQEIKNAQKEAAKNKKNN